MLVARIGKPHGLGGEVYVSVVSDDPERFDAGARLIHETGRALTVESARPHGNRLLVKFEAIDDRAVAEELRGDLFVTSDRLRMLDEDEFWLHEIEGCRVVLPSGEEVGKVSRILPGAAHDLLAVETDRGEKLVPVVKAIVVEVDISRGRVVIDPPQGLLE